MTILEKIKFEEDWLSEVNLTKENIKIALAGIRATVIEQQPCEDCISRQYLIERATSWDKHFADSERCVSLTEIQNAPSVTPNARWIPVKWHIKTEVEEYEQYPGGTVMLDCPMPTEGEDVLITIKGKSGQVWVEKDIALKDEDGWYTDGGYGWVDDIIAWMPLPQPYKAEGSDEE